MRHDLAKLSKKKMRRMNRLTVAELKQVLNPGPPHIHTHHTHTPYTTHHTTHTHTHTHTHNIHELNV